MEDLLYFKRGDTFFYFATWTGAIVTELKSQIRTNSGILIADTIIENTGVAGTFKFSVLNTTAWPIATLLTDIQRTDSNGIINSSKTIKILVYKDVTI